MYVPSDFFRTSLKWQNGVQPQETVRFSKNVQFHVLSKEVDRIIQHSDDLEPADADYLFCSKVSCLK